MEKLMGDDGGKEMVFLLCISWVLDIYDGFEDFTPESTTQSEGSTSYVPCYQTN